LKNAHLILRTVFLGLIGLFFSVTYDFDNVYDLTATTSGLLNVCVLPLDDF
jgi:hypothetical protein